MRYCCSCGSRPASSPRWALAGGADDVESRPPSRRRRGRGVSGPAGARRSACSRGGHRGAACSSRSRVSRGRRVTRGFEGDAGALAVLALLGDAILLLMRRPTRSEALVAALGALARGADDRVAARRGGGRGHGVSGRWRAGAQLKRGGHRGAALRRSESRAARRRRVARGLREMLAPSCPPVGRCTMVLPRRRPPLRGPSAPCWTRWSRR